MQNNHNNDKNVEIAQQAAIVTHCPGDGTLYTFFMAVLDDGKKKTIRVFPHNKGETVNKGLAIKRDDPALSLIDIEPGNSKKNVEELSQKYPDFCARFDENVWTYAEVLLLVKRLFIFGDFHKILQ